MSEPDTLRPPRAPPTREDRPPRGGWTRARGAALLVAPVLLLLATKACAVLLPRGAGGQSADWDVLIVGGVVVAWIAVVVPGGLSDRVVRTIRAARARRRPDEPWLWDHRWDPKGTSVTPALRFARGLLRMRGGDACCVFGALMYFGSWTYFALAAAFWTAWTAWRVWGGGTARVHYAKFPFHPGERVTLSFELSDGGPTFECAGFFLRRVRESSGGIGATHEVYRTFELEDRRPPGALPSPGVEIQLNFDLPDDAGTTRLASSHPRYWTRDVYAQTTAGEYDESFLVPVYERPGGEDEDA